jgi:hypothetical protein
VKHNVLLGYEEGPGLEVKHKQNTAAQCTALLRYAGDGAVLRSSAQRRHAECASGVTGRGNSNSGQITDAAA